MSAVVGACRNRAQRKIIWEVAFAIVLAAGLALAASVGKFYCSGCAFDEKFAFGDAEMFIRGEVNLSVSSWVDPKGNPYEVTLCNGTQCATFLYIKASGVWKKIRVLGS